MDAYQINLMCFYYTGQLSDQTYSNPNGKDRGVVGIM